MDDDCGVREVDLGPGISLRIKEFTMLQDEAGAVVWDAGLVLSYYLAHQHRQGRPLVSGRTCLELGSGTGVVGLAAAALGAAHVYLSDLPHLVPYMRENIQLNGLGATCSALPLEWGDEGHLRAVRACALRTRAPDVLLAADVVYTPAARRSLFKTLAELMAPPGRSGVGPSTGTPGRADEARDRDRDEGDGGAASAAGGVAREDEGEGDGDADGGGGGTEAFLSFEQRPGVEELQELCARHGLVAEQVAEGDLHPSWSCPEIHILRLRMKRPDGGA